MGRAREGEREIGRKKGGGGKEKDPAGERSCARARAGEKTGGREEF